MSVLPNLARPIDLDYNSSAAQCVMSYIEQGHYCTLLGPHFSGKSAVMSYVYKHFSDQEDLCCIYISLANTATTTQTAFYASLAQQIVDEVGIIQPNDSSHTASNEVEDSSSFRAFLHNLLILLDHDLILMLDDIERIPADLLRSLLTALRAIHMEQQHAVKRSGQLVVVVAGALSLAGLTVGESSPFHGIAQRVQLGNLKDEQCHHIVDRAFKTENIAITRCVREELVRSARGNAHLTRLLCRRCIEVVHKTSAPRITTSQLRRVIGRFIRTDAASYPPIQDAIRLIEADPDLLYSILLLLKQIIVPRRQLPLPISPDFDPLFLTGMVREIEGCYQLHNEIYRTFLRQHFHPRRVSHLQVTAGRWNEAIDYLAEYVQAGDTSLRADLLDVTITAIHAAEDLGQVGGLIGRAIATVFEAQEIEVWLLADDKQTLRRIFSSRPAYSDNGYAVAITSSTFETQAFREPFSAQQIEPSGTRHVFPLWIREGHPIGVVSMLYPGAHLAALARGEGTSLHDYLRNAARALREMTNRLTRVEALHELSNVFGGVLTKKEVLKLTLDQIERFVPFDSASIQLMNRNKTALEIEECRGFSDEPGVRALTFPLTECDGPNIRVWYDKVPRRYSHIHETFLHLKEPQYQMTHVQSWLGVPLLVADEVIGVMTLDSFSVNQYTLEDERDAMLVAALAAVAIQRAQLIERQQQEKQLLGAMAQMIGSVQDLQLTWERILAGAIELTGAESGNISKVDESRGMLVDQSRQGLPLKSEPERPIQPNSIQGWVAINQQSVLIYDAHNDERWNGIYMVGREDTCSELAVPIFHGDRQQVVGVINLESPRLEAFASNDQRLLEGLADLAVVALQNAEQYKELERTKDEKLASQAVARLGLFGADWQHTINQKIFAIQGFINNARRDLEAVDSLPPEKSTTLRWRLDKIAEIAGNIRSVPFDKVPAKGADEIIVPTNIDQDLPKIVDRWCYNRSDVALHWALECPNVLVDIPPQWLRVVLEKLVNNALKAMPNGGDLTIATRQQHNSVAITICDTGKGIPKHAQPYFLKIPVPRTSSDSGSGMGALIARFVALEYKGELQLIATERDQGTELLLTLPIKQLVTEPTLAREQAA